jgi:peptide/nickel transport system ATP-binding protein
MKELQQETGMAILFITHDLAVVNRMADDVCVMYAGKVAEFGSREEIFGNMQHPYTRRLLESIPAGANIGYRLQTIPGRVPDAADYRACGCRFHDRCIEHLAYCKDVDPPAFKGSGPENHVVHCHLLDPAFRGDRSGASKKIPRPPKQKGNGRLLAAQNLQTYFPVKKGIFQRLAQHVKAVDGVDIDIRCGETLALVGESGCGKTTVGLSILRLLEEARGELVFQEQNLFAMPRKRVKQMRKHMQIVFQDPRGSLSPRLKVGDIVAEGLQVHAPGLSAAQRREKVDEVLELVGLSPSLVDRFPHEFSGGQRQRLAIARALILDPEFLVLDEPTSALDVSVQAQILNLLEDIQVKRGLSYLFITHNLGVVEYISDHVAVMYLGRIVEYAATGNLFRNPRHPYTRTLFDAVPRIDDEHRAFAKIGGDVPSPLNPPPGCHFHPRCPIAIERCRQECPELRGLDGTRVACHRADEAAPVLVARSMEGDRHFGCGG